MIRVLSIVLLLIVATEPARAALAVAISPSGGAVLSSRWADMNYAKSDAKRECHHRYGSTGEVIASRPGGCVAIGSDGSKWAVVKTKHQSELDAAALDGCKAKGGGNCRVMLRHCGS